MPQEDQPGPALALPGGAGNSADPDRVRRGVGYALSFKNFAFPEGSDDYSTAAVKVQRTARDSILATVTCAAAEVGQGFVTLAQQIVRTELGIADVLLGPADTSVGSAGSSSASRQAYMSGGAVQMACGAVRAEARGRAERRGIAVDDHLPLGDDVWLAVLDDPIEMVREFHHRPTEPLDENGQGHAHVGFAFAAHRAVVDVDLDLGLVRVQQVATAQDVGRALNPMQVLGQIEGGIAQGLGLAVMEELITDRGRVLNPSFTDYLIPTVLDVPEVVASLIEEPEPDAPFGVKGVGEPPVISSTPAIVAAIRDACGVWLTDIPVRPTDIALAAGRSPL
jgi:CO/xanthine dehydrogenase Mo-binding subunit